MDIVDFGNFVNIDPSLLKRLTFLKGVDDKESWYMLAKAITDPRFGDGQRIFAQDQQADAIYFVLEGKVRWERLKPRTSEGEPILRYHVNENGLLGQYAFLYNAPYPMTATADGPCYLLRIENSALDHLLYRFPFIRRQMMPYDIIGRLRTVPWLAELDDMDISLLAEAVLVQDLPANCPIYNRDESNPETFYIIDRGQVKLIDPRLAPRDVGYLGNGAVFGITPLLTGGSRYRNIADTICPSRIFAIPNEILRMAARFLPSMKAGDRRQQREAALARDPLFSAMSPDDIAKIAGYVSHVYFPRHHLIGLQEKSAHALWLLMPGSKATLHVMDGKDGVMLNKQVIGPISFGEEALVLDLSVASPITANPQSEWLKLHRQDLLAMDRAEDGRIMPLLTSSPATIAMRKAENESRSVIWLANNEDLLIYQRRHWVILLRKMTGGLILGGIWAVLALVVWGLNGVGLLVGVMWTVGIMAVLASLWGWLDYFNDFLFVTNQRIVQQDKVIFFYERRREASLYQVQSIDVETGLIGHFLSYGDLVIRTASKGGNIIFDFAPNPTEIKDVISKQLQIQRNNLQAQNKMDIQTMLEERLGIDLHLPEQVLVPSGKESAAPPKASEGKWTERLRRFFSPLPEHWSGMSTVVWRQHWILLVGKLLTPVFFLLISIVVGLGGFSGTVRSLTGAFQAIEFVALLVGFASLGVGIWILLDWHNDTYELTNTSIMDVAKLPFFFADNRREAQLSEIQDIQLDVPTPIHYIFNYGNVKISTAAAEGAFTFDNVGDPHGVAEEIRRRIEQWRIQDERERARRRAQELPNWFEIYKQLDSDEPRGGVRRSKSEP